MRPDSHHEATLNTVYGADKQCKKRDKNDQIAAFFKDFACVNARDWLVTLTEAVRYSRWYRVIFSLVNSDMKIAKLSLGDLAIRVIVADLYSQVIAK